MPRMPTHEELQMMSDEEVATLNRQLALAAFNKFMAFHVLKWAAIFGVSYGVRKLIERLPEER